MKNNGVTKRIKEIETEIKADEKSLQDVLLEMKTLQERAQMKMAELEKQAKGIDNAITSRKGGLLELQKIMEK